MDGFQQDVLPLSPTGAHLAQPGEHNPARPEWPRGDLIARIRIILDSWHGPVLGMVEMGPGHCVLPLPKEDGRVGSRDPRSTPGHGSPGSQVPRVPRDPGRKADRAPADSYSPYLWIAQAFRRR